MKKIINDPDDIVIQMGKGIEKSGGGSIVFDECDRVIRRRDIEQDKVSLISGGGSGHEPAHAGYVGKGMLDAAVCGGVFASPSSTQVYNAILSTRTNKGTLLIIKNYTGDCMNFNMAADLAQEEGVKIEKVYVNDDIAVKDSLYTAGRRGVAGTVLVHKIAGAAADMGMELEDVKEVAQKTIDNVRTIGFGITSCTVPAKGTPTFVLDEDEMEYGVGIHGEPGIKRDKLLTADEVSKRMVDALVSDLPFHPGDEVVAMVNGLGGTPLMELYVLNNSVMGELERHGLNVYKDFVGNFLTAIDMAGASVTLLKIDEQLKKLIDYPVNTLQMKA